MRRLRRLAVNLRTVVNDTRGQELGSVRWINPQWQEAFSEDNR
jgi:hypothetical protein